MIPNKPKTTPETSPESSGSSLLLPVKNIDHSQTNFGRQVQAYILPVAQANYLPIRNFNIDEPELQAKAAGLFDIASEKVLYSKNIDMQLPIASVTKLMTAVVAMESLSLTVPYVVSAEDINADGNGADLAKGEEILGSDLLKIMLIESSNDAALVFASNAGKKGINLVSKMNEKAREIGMTNTKFADPSGLDDSDAHSTVADLIKLARYVDKYPIIWEITATKNAIVSSIDGKISHTLTNTNKLLGEYPGIIGGKTGTTPGALETMVLEVKIYTEDSSGVDDIRVIALVLGTNDRFGEIKKIIEWGKQAYSWK
jgi:D-alanyl-D-alanine carboxypeptidase